MIKKTAEIVIKIDSKIRNILQILAKSNKPISSREVEKIIIGQNKKRDRQVYRIIDNELCIKKFEHKFFLFIWEDLLASIDSKIMIRKEINLKRVMENINAIDWSFDWSMATFEKDDDGNTITITKGFNEPHIMRNERDPKSKDRKPRIMRIERDPKSKDRAILTIFKDGKQRGIPVHLYIKVVNKKQYVFYEGIVGNPFEEGKSYLKVSLNGRASKIVERIKSMNPDLFNYTDDVKMIAEKCLLSKIDDSALISSVSQIESIRRNWKYYLNTRGLILYILAMITEERTSGRQKNVEISKALQNIGESFKDEFSFLMHYPEIKRIYDKMAEDRRRSNYEYFQVKCLKQIALELQYSLDTLNKNDLDYYITKRYVDDTMQYFLVGTKWNPLMSIDSIPAIIREYYTHNQILIRRYLEGQLEVCNFEIGEFNSMKQDSIHTRPSFNKDTLIDGFSTKNMLK